jgi:trigger factor
MEFQVAIQDIDEITKQLSVTVPQERVAKEYDSSLKQVAKTAHIKGFRPGKVPRHMVEKMMGDRIRYDVANKLINESLRQAYDENKLEVVGSPDVELKEVEPTKAMEFSAKVSLYPQPVIANYKNRSVSVAKRVVADSDVDASIVRIRESKAELSPVEGREDAQKGDVIALSVAVSADGGEFSRGEPFVDELGNGKLPKEVEDGVVGMTKEQDKEITFVGGEDLPNAELRGKSLTYKVSLHGIFTKKLPEFNDDFVKTLGMDVETVDALTAKVREQLVAQAEEEAKSESQGALLDLLAKENPFKVPSVMIDEEIRGIIARYGFAGRGANPDDIDVTPFRAQFEDFATNRIRCAIIVDQIGSLEDVKVEESDRDAMLQRIADQNGSTVEQVRKNLMDRSRIMGFLLEVRRTKILDFMMANTTITYTDAPAVTESSAAA